MKISARYEALQILGLPVNASSQEIKSRYKQLAKSLHPDVVGGDKACDAYTMATQAYMYLLETEGKAVLEPSTNVYKGQTSSYREYTSAAKRPARVLGGNDDVLKMAATKRAFQEERVRQEKKLKKQQEEKKKAFEEAQKKQKEDLEYKKAMEAINAIRAARMIEAMMKEK